MLIYPTIKMSPLLGLQGSGGGLGYLAGGVSGYPADTFWISEAAKGNWGSEYVKDIAGDNEGNIYVVSTRYDAGGNGYLGNSIVKHASDGTVSWQKINYRTASPYPMEIKSVIAEPDGDHIYFSGAADAGMFVTKVNKNDGSVDWRRRLGSVTAGNSNPCIAIGSGGNPIVVARLTDASDAQGYFSLNESDGTTDWKTLIKKTSGNTTASTHMLTPAVDSSGNIHTVVWGDTGHPNYYNAVIKHNSSGVFQSISDYRSSYTNEDMFSDIAVDSSGNKYVAFRFVSGSGQQFKVGIMKLNSSDVIQWQKAISGTSPNYMTPNNIVVMPEDAGIILSIEDRQNQGDSADGRVSFVRFDMSGNVVWKRHFGVGDGGSGININGSNGRMKLNRNGNIIFDTRFSSGGAIYTVVAQLPADGSLTGDTVIGSRTYNWSANTRFSFSDQTIFSKQGSSIFSSATNSLSNNSYDTNMTTADNVQTFTKGDVD
tara:strand:- start:213 stop:1664 length:1452 start_codon:yes stop_codon:yes gene_type:complete